jgi:hypothetical protein
MPDPGQIISPDSPLFVEGTSAMDRCVECLREFPKEERMTLSGVTVCASCKPLAVAKIVSGKPLGTLWRRKKLLVVVRTGEGIDLPPRCVRCNAPAERQVGIMQLPVLHSARIRYFVCEAHWKTRWWRICGGLALMAVGLGMIAAAISLRSAWTPILFICGLCVVPVALLYCREVLLNGQTATHSFLRGCSRAFLAEFPEWPEDR